MQDICLAPSRTKTSHFIFIIEDTILCLKRAQATFWDQRAIPVRIVLCPLERQETKFPLSTCRFGPYFVSPVIAGLQPDLTPYLAGTDSIGAIETAKDFMVAGTAPDSLLGMCESMWRPDMVGLLTLLRLTIFKSGIHLTSSALYAAKESTRPLWDEEILSCGQRDSFCRLASGNWEALSTCPLQCQEQMLSAGAGGAV